MQPAASLEKKHRTTKNYVELLSEPEVASWAYMVHGLIIIMNIIIVIILYV